MRRVIFLLAIFVFGITLTQFHTLSSSSIGGIQLLISESEDIYRTTLEQVRFVNISSDERYVIANTSSGFSEELQHATYVWELNQDLLDNSQSEVTQIYPTSSYSSTLYDAPFWGNSTISPNSLYTIIYSDKSIHLAKLPNLAIEKTLIIDANGISQDMAWAEDSRYVSFSLPRKEFVVWDLYQDTTYTKELENVFPLFISYQNEHWFISDNRGRFAICSIHLEECEEYITPDGVDKAIPIMDGRIVLSIMQNTSSSQLTQWHRQSAFEYELSEDIIINLGRFGSLSNISPNTQYLHSNTQLWDIQNRDIIGEVGYSINFTHDSQFFISLNFQSDESAYFLSLWSINPFQVINEININERFSLEDSFMLEELGIGGISENDNWAILKWSTSLLLVWILP